ncbi:glycosyltransferase family 2 protein [Microbacterium sp. SS28]|uniref:glycosyltransferase n=1 Tax=Microbacterium sp. SS28 TaxID=2919948 RepID=UPI001FA9AC61|nr:glycosyltransferase [Microbacterium sp. SS28]
MNRRVDAIAVIVPAHDEEQLIGACLASIGIAARAARHAVDHLSVWAVLDACTDRSADIARDAGVELLAVDARSVGTARATGVRAALDRLVGIRPDRIWTAHTDADSVVPVNWLTHQLSLARRGVDVVVGTVRPDFRDLDASQIEAWLATHTPGAANGHVHGANLGIRANVLLDAGGFTDATVHEDVWLIDEIRARGGRLAATDGAWVRTSGRQVGRAPDGYARYLREDLVALADAARSTLPAASTPR